MINFEMLVNHENKLNRSYIPDDLIIIDENENNFHNYIDPNTKPMVSKSILPSFLKMQYDMSWEGLYIIIDSGYRSYDYQENILNKEIEKKGNEAYKYVAIPGTSEHQTGLSIDIALLKNGIYCDDIKEDDPEIIWLSNNCYKYGFILRYPKGREHITKYNFEPWHYRYVGKRLSHLLTYFDITLEEYYEKKKTYDEIFQEDNPKNADFIFKKTK